MVLAANAASGILTPTGVGLAGRGQAGQGRPSPRGSLVIHGVFRCARSSMTMGGVQVLALHIVKSDDVREHTTATHVAACPTHVPTHPLERYRLGNALVASRTMGFREKTGDRPPSASRCRNHAAQAPGDRVRPGRRSNPRSGRGCSNERGCAGMVQAAPRDRRCRQHPVEIATQRAAGPSVSAGSRSLR